MRLAAWRGLRNLISSRFLWAAAPGMDEDAFERKLYVVRKLAEREIAESDIED